MKVATIKSIWKLGLAGLALIAISCWALLPLAYGDQPHMHRALSNLQAARAELQASSHNKGGHRGNAINLINQAIVEVERGIHYGRTHH